MVCMLSLNWSAGSCSGLRPMITVGPDGKELRVLPEKQHRAYVDDSPTARRRRSETRRTAG
jgi:hypothetical protein